MTDERPDVDAEAVAERRHLVSLAFRMLGTLAEAEDAVQETYIRWYRMSQAERDAIEVPRAWLTRAASRICLDVLNSARARRERYVGPWLPEPVPVSAFSEAPVDPVDLVTLDESISTALLIVLEAMTPSERVVFVLHDVFAIPFGEIAATVGRTPTACRQLATAARRRIEQSRAHRVSRHEHEEVVRAFATAARGGDVQTLIGKLAPEVVLRTDGGGLVTAARKPVFGADRVARFLIGVLQRMPGVEMLDQQTNDGLGFALWVEGKIIGIGTLNVIHDRITDVWIALNPQKLSLWN